MNWQKELRFSQKQLRTESFYNDNNFFFLIFIFNCKELTYNTYLQTMIDTYATNKTVPTYKKYLFTMWDTYATNNTILYLQYKTCNTYLQWDTYTTNSAILHALHI